MMPLVQPFLVVLQPIGAVKLQAGHRRRQTRYRSSVSYHTVYPERERERERERALIYQTFYVICINFRASAVNISDERIQPAFWRGQQEIEIISYRREVLRPKFGLRPS